MPIGLTKVKWDIMGMIQRMRRSSVEPRFVRLVHTHPYYCSWRFSETVYFPLTSLVVFSYYSKYVNQRKRDP